MSYLSMLYPDMQLEIFRELKDRWSEFEALDKADQKSNRADMQKEYDAAILRKKKRIVTKPNKPK